MGTITQIKYPEFSLLKNCVDFYVHGTVHPYNIV